MLVIEVLWLSQWMINSVDCTAQTVSRSRSPSLDNSMVPLHGKS